MQGRIERNQKLEEMCKGVLDRAPAYVEEYYISLSSSREMSTCYTYLCAIELFLDTYSNGNSKEVNPQDVTDVDLATFLNGLKTRIDNRGRETSFSYRKTTWFALKSFFGYLYKKRYVDSNPMELIEKPRNRDEIKRQPITPEQIKSLLTQFTKDLDKKPPAWQATSLRNRAMYSLLFTTGMRVSACCAINKEDLDLENRTIKVIDKRHKTFTYNLCDSTFKDLENYLDRRDSLIVDNDNDALFLTEKGDRINSHVFRNKMTYYSRKYLGVNIHPHQFRATFCTSLYEATRDIEFVRRAVGHNNISTTLRYIAPDNTAREKASNIMNKLLV